MEESPEQNGRKAHNKYNEKERCTESLKEGR